MLYLIGNFLYTHYPSMSWLRLVNYLSFRSLAAALTASFLLFCVSRYFILYMHRNRFHDQLRDTGIGTASDKKGTPTMGGLLVVGAIIGSLILWGDWQNRFLVSTCFLFVGFGLIGFLDDMLKNRRSSGDRGMSERTKLLLQTTIAGLFSIAVFMSWAGVPGSHTTLLYLPFVKTPVADLGFLYIPFSILFIILVSNSVNLADGLDGLAITPSIFVMMVLGIFAYIEGNSIHSAYLNYPYFNGAGELLVFGSAFSGAGLAFLWYNAYPAQIFLGDTGSLAIGGAFSAACILLKQEFLFPILGGFFVTAALTSQIQDKIGIKWLGRRLFYRAPIHHSMQYKGLAETKVVIRIWIISGILSLVALATIKLR